jgi:hypothetical protein
MAGPTIVAKFVADTKGLTSGLDKLESEGSSKLGGFASAAKSAAAIAGGAFAAVGIVDFAKDAIGAASDLSESVSKIGQVFKTSGDDILTWSDNAATAMGLSKQAALEAAGTFGNLAQSVGLPEGQAADMSKSLVGLAADLGSFNNVPVDDALLALRSGLTGETEPLKKFGVAMNETSLKAEALRLGLVTAAVDQDKLSQAQENSEKAARKAAEALKAHGENSVEFQDATRDAEQANSKLAAVMEGKVPASLTAAEKAQAAYSLIMQQTTTAQGDFGRTSEGLANSTKIAGAKFDDLKAKVGGVFLPALTAVMGYISDTVLPGLEQFGQAVGGSEAFQTVSRVITETVLPALQSITTWLSENKDVMLAAFIGIGAAVAAVVVPAFLLWAGAAAGAAVATLLAAAPFILIGAAIAAVALVIIKNWDTIGPIVTGVFNAIIGAAQAVIGWIVEHWQLLFAIITGPIGLAVALVVSHWDTITAAVGAVINWITDHWGTILAVITGPIGIAVAIITTHWDTIKAGATAVWQWVTDKWNAIRDGISSAITAIGGFISTLVDVFFKRPLAAAQELLDGVRNAFNSMVDAIQSVVGKIGDTVSRLVDVIKAPINALFRAWNGLAFTIPRINIPEVEIPFVGKVGGGSFGGISIPFPQLPQLAAGGVLSAPTLFLGGEAGTEIVAPERLLRSIVAEESAGGNYTLNLYPRQVDVADVAYAFARLEIMAGLA